MSGIQDSCHENYHHPVTDFCLCSHTYSMALWGLKAIVIAHYCDKSDIEVPKDFFYHYDSVLVEYTVCKIRISPVLLTF